MSGVGKQWAKPQLIVIGRGAPEESVLLKCKNAQSSIPCDNAANLVSQQS